jgi:hypothetical protein
MMSNEVQPLSSAAPGNRSDEYTHLIDEAGGHIVIWSKDQKTLPARAASYVWVRKWHILFFIIFVATSVPLLLMARDGVFSPGLLVVCSATMLAWVMFRGFERERRRAKKRNEGVCSREV